jgi:hypothetical protein
MLDKYMTGYCHCDTHLSSRTATGVAAATNNNKAAETLNIALE